MAEAKKCDVCGALYERPLCNREVEVVKDCHYYGSVKYDLCDDCYEELLNWLGKRINKLVR